jgi:hypothetical protein
MQIVERRIRDYTAISEELSLQVEGVRSCPGPKNGHLAEKSAEVGLSVYPVPRGLQEHIREVLPRLLT